MGLFSKKDEGKKTGESQRLTREAPAATATAPAPAPVVAPTAPATASHARPKLHVAIKTFVIGLAATDKLAPVGDARFEEGLRSSLPPGASVTRVGHADGGVRLFEVGLVGVEDMTDVLSALVERGLLNGEVKLALDRCMVVCKATGVNAPLGMSGEPIERTGMRVTIRSTSSDVQLQYPPAEIHKRWQPDDDYRDAFAKWRAQRGGDAPGRWHGSWPAQANLQDAPPWVKLVPNGPGAYIIEFDDAVQLRFAFQGAETTIMRFNLRVMLNTVTAETAVYKSLPVSLESIPRDLVERMNKEPERFAPLRAPGQFGASYDLVRQLWEEAGGDYFHLETPHGTSGSGTESGEHRRVAPKGAAPKGAPKGPPPKGVAPKGPPKPLPTPSGGPPSGSTPAPPAPSPSALDRMTAPAPAPSDSGTTAPVSGDGAAETAPAASAPSS
jgi:hypothetical protein